MTPARVAMLAFNEVRRQRRRQQRAREQAAGERGHLLLRAQPVRQHSRVQRREADGRRAEHGQALHQLRRHVVRK